MPAFASRVLLFALLLFSPGRAVTAQQTAAHSGHGSPPNVESTAVIRTIEALFAAVERSDLEALDTLYAGDSLLVIEGAGINRGWRDYRDNHLAPELREFRNFKYRPFELEVRVSGDLAWATYRYSMTADVGERRVDVVGRGTVILERNGTRWVVRLTQTASRARRPTDPPMP